MPEPVGAVIEIVERRTKPADPDSYGAQLVIPNEVRINGQQLLLTQDNPIVIHEIKPTDDSLVTVTLTLVARRVVIEAQDPEEVNVGD